MVHAVNIIDAGGFDKTLNVFRDSITARSVNIGSLRALLPANQRNNPVIVQRAASDYLQMLIDDRIALSAFPEDPDFQTDPQRPEFFHARIVGADQIGNGQNAVAVYRPVALVGGTATHLVARETLATVQWDGTTVNILTETPPTVLR